MSITIYILYTLYTIVLWSDFFHPGDAHFRSFNVSHGRKNKLESNTYIYIYIKNNRQKEKENIFSAYTWPQYMYIKPSRYFRTNPSNGLKEHSTPCGVTLPPPQYNPIPFALAHIHILASSGRIAFSRARDFTALNSCLLLRFSAGCRKAPQNSRYRISKKKKKLYVCSYLFILTYSNAIWKKNLFKFVSTLYWLRFKNLISE